MGSHAFLRIVDTVSNSDPYFQQRIDAVGRKFLSPLQKCTAAMRMLVYDVSGDVVDDYVRIEESTAVEYLKKFVYNVCSIFESEYLRKPNSNDVQLAGSNNDINVLDRSPVFDDVLQGCAPESRFAIVRGPTRFWDRADLGRIIRVCIIIHKLIVEDKRDTYATQFGSLPTYDDTTNGLPESNLEKNLMSRMKHVQNSMQMRDRQKYRQLKNDLVEYISQFHNNR
ncbi:uncharacterized protein LOC141660754 [Apium graveolens]|uniref:uncharacterized protein LOC141660754 n=1 Tax=Apium graveolens TaxID=4045 RepID=UPI003D7B6736